MSETDACYYRFEDIRYALLPDEFGDRRGRGRLAVELRRFAVIKRTPKGAWLLLNNGDKRFVLTTAHKQFACPSVEEAIISFRARKTRQVRIYEARAAQARESIELVRAYKTSKTASPII